MSTDTPRIISTLLLFIINNAALLLLAKYGIKAIILGLIILFLFNIGLLISIIKLFPYQVTDVPQFMKNAFADTITLISGMVLITIISAIISYKMANTLVTTLIISSNFFLFIFSMGIVSKMNF